MRSQHVQDTRPVTHAGRASARADERARTSLTEVRELVEKFENRGWNVGWVVELGTCG